MTKHHEIIIQNLIGDTLFEIIIESESPISQKELFSIINEDFPGLNSKSEEDLLPMLEKLKNENYIYVTKDGKYSKVLTSGIYKVPSQKALLEEVKKGNLEIIEKKKFLYNRIGAYIGIVGVISATILGLLNYQTGRENLRITSENRNKERIIDSLQKALKNYVTVPTKK